MFDPIAALATINQDDVEAAVIAGLEQVTPEQAEDPHLVNAVQDFAARVLQLARSLPSKVILASNENLDTLRNRFEKEDEELFRNAADGIWNILIGNGDLADIPESDQENANVYTDFVMASAFGKLFGAVVKAVE